MHALLIDDHALFRCGMRFLLSDLDDEITCVEAGSVDDAARHVAAPVGLILLDLHLPGRSGIAALVAVRNVFPDTPIVVVSGDQDPSLVRDTVCHGATAFIPKALPPAQMIGALRRVLAGGAWLPPQAHGSDAGGRADAAPSPPGSMDIPMARLALGAREHDVLLLAVQGKSPQAIARALAVEPAEAAATLSAAFDALGVSDRTEAVYAAAHLGLALRALPAAG